MTISCCEFCGRDTKNKCRICRHCLISDHNKPEQAHEGLEAWTELGSECEYDYSEDSMGPKLREQFGDVKWEPTE